MRNAWSKRKWWTVFILFLIGFGIMGYFCAPLVVSSMRFLRNLPYHLQYDDAYNNGVGYYNEGLKLIQKAKVDLDLGNDADSAHSCYAAHEKFMEANFAFRDAARIANDHRLGKEIDTLIKEYRKRELKKPSVEKSPPWEGELITLQKPKSRLPIKAYYIVYSDEDLIILRDENGKLLMEVGDVKVEINSKDTYEEIKARKMEHIALNQAFSSLDAYKKNIQLHSRQRFLKEIMNILVKILRYIW